MSEYVTVESERTEDPNVIELTVNQLLTREDEEVYATRQAGENGSTLAQTLFFGVDGLEALIITEDQLIITRQPDAAWEMIIDEVRDILRDFFL